MAFKGFFLTETVGSWWYFEKREPARVLYRLAPIDERGENAMKHGRRST